MRIPYTAYLLIAVLAAALFATANAAKRYKAHYSRTLDNLQALHADLDSIALANGRSAAENRVLALRLEEFKALKPRLAHEMQQLQLPVKRIEAAAMHAFTLQQRAIVVPLYHTHYDTVPVRTFTYQDPHIALKGWATDSTQHLEFAYTDTLVQTLYRGKRPKPWLWIFSPRPLVQRAALKSPHARLHYSRHIQIHKP